MPTMQEIDQVEVEIKSCLNQLFAIHPELALDLCAAARRGVEADRLRAERDEHARWRSELADKLHAAEAELAALKAAQTDQRGPDAQDNAGAGIDAASQARCEHSGPRPNALKAAQPQEYPSSADDEATRWRHGEKL